MKKLNLIIMAFLGFAVMSCNHIFEEQTALNTVPQEENIDPEFREKDLPNKKCNYRLQGSEGGYPAFSCSIMGKVCSCSGGGGPIAYLNVSLDIVKTFFPSVNTWDDVYELDYNSNDYFVNYLNHLSGE
jgi:hypothetical protein